MLPPDPTRRDFLARTGSLAISVVAGAAVARAARGPADRVGMGTVVLRNRFGNVAKPLTLLDVPAYYRERFGVRRLEFWSHHFESLEQPYLRELHRRVKSAGAELVNVQVDEPYDLASTDEAERQRSLVTVRRWIDAAALLRSRAVRINPGRAGGGLGEAKERQTCEVTPAWSSAAASSAHEYM